MAGQSDSYDSAPTIFSADMTKLIAADSCITILGQPGRSLSAPMDPDAPQSFEALCTVLTNDTLVHFKKPDVFPKGPRPVMAAWNTVAEELFEKGKVPRPAPASGLPDLSPDKQCEIMIGPFDNYTNAADTTERLKAFACFQFSDPEVMTIFWHNNSEADLRIALNIFQAYRQRTPSFAAGFTNAAPSKIDSVSKEHLTGNWTAEEFTTAYVFWAFVKGYRYAASLSSKHIYAVHWLREPAMRVDCQLSPLAEENLHALFPWGPFLSELIHYPEFKDKREEVTEAILKLRRYTISDLEDHATDISKLREFTRQGLTQCLPKVNGDADWYGRVSETASMVLSFRNALQNGAPFVSRFLLPIAVRTLNLVINPSAKARFNNEVDRRLRLLFYRSTIRSIIKWREQELADWLQRRE